MERAEASVNQILLVFLDWEKAFDRVRQDKLVEALTRMGIPSKFVTAVRSLYNNPSFCVRVGAHKSSWRVQQRGIREGCPLSPYLFIMLMSVLFMFDSFQSQALCFDVIPNKAYLVHLCIGLDIWDPLPA